MILCIKYLVFYHGPVPDPVFPAEQWGLLTGVQSHSDVSKGLQKGEVSILLARSASEATSQLSISICLFRFVDQQNWLKGF